MQQEYIIRVKGIVKGPIMEMFFMANNDEEAKEKMSEIIVELGYGDSNKFDTNLYRIQWISGV